MKLELMSRFKWRIEKLMHPIRSRTVSIEKLLQGGEAGIGSRRYALLTRDIRRASTKFIDGPHVAFLREYQTEGKGILESRHFVNTSYFKNAQTCIDLTGNYFTAQRDDQIVDVARDFIDRFEGRLNEVTYLPKYGQSNIGSPVLVRAIPFSKAYSVVDGNHRLAIAYMNGGTSVKVGVLAGEEYTPLLRMLKDVLWTGGSNELYQPVDLPECEDEWVVVRRCTDRLGMFRRFLGEMGWIGTGRSYLDIGSYYGWFVSEMARLGFDSYGIERDPIAAEIGQWVYGNRPEQVYIGDCARLLQKGHARTYDVVSIQSVLHHFAMGKGAISAEDLIRLVDKVTGTVLFFETGQEHEAWFRESLRGWNPEFIEGWLRENTTFSKVVRLGVDEDAVGNYRENYGRTMFACIR